MAIAFLPVTQPASLAKDKNGYLGPCNLHPVFMLGHGFMNLHPVVARVWNALNVACLAATGMHLSSSVGGCYRPFAQQLSGFLTSYVALFDANTCEVWGQRTYNGAVWYLLKGHSAKASPGTSNHGLGLAIDLSIWNMVTQREESITAEAAVWQWVQDNAVEFGFSWEGAQPGQPGWEPWHVRYVLGDVVTARVTDIEAFVGLDPAA